MMSLYKRTYFAGVGLVLFVIAIGSAAGQDEKASDLRVTEVSIVFPDIIQPPIVQYTAEAGKSLINVHEYQPNREPPATIWYHAAPPGVSMLMDRGINGIPRFEKTDEGTRDRLYSLFSASYWYGKGHLTMFPSMSPRYIEDMSAISPNHFPYPEVASKKGLQVQMIDDAIALGVKHAALNVSINSLFDWSDSESAIPFTLDGERFRFRRSAVEGLDRRIKPLSDAGMIVYLILLNYKGTGSAEGDRILLHPGYNDACPNNLSAFNTVTDEGLAHYKAVCEFLVERYTRPDQRHGRALNFIIGNEVNSHWWWCNMGNVSMHDFLVDYQRAVRIACTAARKYCAVARVYISLEHHWGYAFTPDPLKSFPGRDFVDRFAERARQYGDFPWHVAYHPYPENLGEPATWNDRTAIDAYFTPRITFKNLHVLTDYFQRDELLYRGQPRHIILSEQGFHTKDTPDGETLQAAAYCYAWVKTRDLDGIDAFILHRHVDHGGEGGLRLGLWARDETASHPARPARKKPIYDVFKKADTPDWRDAFEFALPIIDIADWSEITKGSNGKGGH